LPIAPDSPLMLLVRSHPSILPVAT
jgi:hypothetical protein